MKLHKANIRYTFAKRTNNISLVLGLGLCLFMNINAFTIWDTLYNDQQARAKFSSGEYLSSAQSLIKENEDRLEGNTKASAEELRKELEEQREVLLGQIHHLQVDVYFGIGKIWREKVEWWPGFFCELFGSLLTGILVSIGAPYWHDLLQALIALRHPKKTSKTS